MRRLLYLIIICPLLTACYYSHPERLDHWQPMGENTVDSVTFYIAHHYWKGYNFETTDSLRLAPALPPVELKGSGLLKEEQPIDSLTLVKGTRLVVTDILYVPRDTVDSVWVRLASEEGTMGWQRERTLLDGVVPADPISQAIYHFSDRRTLVFVCLIGLALIGYLIAALLKRERRKRGDIYHTPYPTLLCLLTALAAALYGIIQSHAPSTWVEFYFHPTINPFTPGLPLILAAFLASLWLLIIGAVATAIDMLAHENPSRGMLRLATTGATCIVIYLGVTLTAGSVLLYPLLLLVVGGSIWLYHQSKPNALRCGHCGQPLKQLGVCPHCGALNE